jgi:hypothetical protein
MNRFQWIEDYAAAIGGSEALFAMYDAVPGSPDQRAAAGGPGLGPRRPQRPFMIDGLHAIDQWSKRLEGLVSGLLVIRLELSAAVLACCGIAVLKA